MSGFVTMGIIFTMGAPTPRVTPADGWRRPLIGPHWSPGASHWTTEPQCDPNQWDVTVTNWSQTLSHTTENIDLRVKKVSVDHNMDMGIRGRPPDNKIQMSLFLPLLWWAGCSLHYPGQSCTQTSNPIKQILRICKTKDDGRSRQNHTINQYGAQKKNLQEK